MNFRKRKSRYISEKTIFYRTKRFKYILYIFNIILNKGTLNKYSEIIFNIFEDYENKINNSNRILEGNKLYFK